MRVAIDLVLLLASAAAYALCFPPTGAQALAWVALVPLIAVVTRATPGRAAAYGYAWAVAMAIGITDWLPPAIALYYEQPLWLGYLIFGGATAVMVAVHYALFALYCSYAYRRYPLSWPILAGAAWVVAELARSRLLTGNPWGLYGNTQVALMADGYDGYGAFALRLLQIADIFGIYAVGFLFCLGNAVVVQLWRSRQRRVSALPMLLVLAAAVALFTAYGQSRIATFAELPEPSVRVSVAQANLDLGYRWKREHYGKNLDAYLDLTREAIEDRAPDLMVWPENAMTFFLDARSDYRWTIAEVTEPAGLELVAGGPRYEEGSGRTEYFNSAFVLTPAGEVTGIYDKEHLLPFAEYFPFGSLNLLRRSFGPEEDSVSQITPGTRTAPVATVAGNAAIAICNEIMFPDIVRRRVAANSHYILNLANDGWMQSREFAEHQLVLAVARAVEHRRYLVRASTSGPSAIVDPTGRILARSDAYEQAVVSGSIAPLDRATPYSRTGDLFGLGCLLSVLATAMRRGRGGV